MLLFAPLSSFLIASGLLVILLSPATAKFALDHPNARSLHTSPVPRTGGLAIVAATLAVWSALSARVGTQALLPFAGLVLLSLLDDIKGLPVLVRFAGHFAAAGYFAFTGPMSESGVLISAFSVLAIVWMTNLYNFMDGSDGLAGGMTLFGFGFCGFAAWLAGDIGLAILAFTVSAAALAFLRVNFHPARIFMGDAGSVPLGFLAAAVGAVGWQKGVWPVWFPVLVFSPFVMDASVTLVKRLLRGERVWQAHREHYYQHLVQSGLGHRNTALAEYALMAACGASALWARGQSAWIQGLTLAGWGVVYLALALVVERRWAHFNRMRAGNGSA